MQKKYLVKTAQNQQRGGELEQLEERKYGKLTGVGDVALCLWLDHNKPEQKANGSELPLLFPEDELP